MPLRLAVSSVPEPVSTTLSAPVDTRQFRDLTAQVRQPYDFKWSTVDLVPKAGQRVYDPLE